MSCRLLWPLPLQEPMGRISTPTAPTLSVAQGSMGIKHHARAKSARCSSQDAKPCAVSVRRCNIEMANLRMSLFPSLCRLRTWTMISDLVRVVAQVAEEGLEPPTRG